MYGLDILQVSRDNVDEPRPILTKRSFDRILVIVAPKLCHQSVHRRVIQERGWREQQTATKLLMILMISGVGNGLQELCQKRRSGGTRHPGRNRKELVFVRGKIAENRTEERRHRGWRKMNADACDLDLGMPRRQSGYHAKIAALRSLALVLECRYRDGGNETWLRQCQ